MTDTHPIDRMVDEMLLKAINGQGVVRLNALLALREKFREVMHENHRINTRLMLANEMARELDAVRTALDADGGPCKESLSIRTAWIIATRDHCEKELNELRKVKTI
jgi:hypothetical protein